MTNYWLLLDFLRLAIVVVVMAYAAGMDIRHNEVSNKTWLYAPIGFLLMLIEYVTFAPSLLPWAFGSIAITVTISLVFFYMKHGLGGADSKALITLAVSYPLGPISTVFFPLFPLIAFWVGAMLVTAVMVIRHKKQTAFLPYIFVGLLVAIIL